ncbi:MAG TPA: putative inorganic carbon transporter subunit DabA [Acidimicrobiales bacterium]|nr:putative inorganic carbon transporter subunit DabA [Acidimicrobiales bacterium]
MSALAGLAILLPVVAGVVALVRRTRRTADLVTVALVGATAAGAVVALGAPRSTGAIGPVVDLGVATATLGVVGGRLEGILLLVVCGIGAVVAAASARALRGEPAAGRFAGALALTVAATAAVAVAASLPVLAVAWVAVTPALWLLLTHDRSVPGAAAAAGRVVRRLAIGDAALVAGVVAAAVAFDDLDLAALGDGAATASATTLALVLVPLAIGGFVRSAQIPAHGWLPLTVWAPSPVSALLHAGVVNAAGVLLVRLAPAVAASPAVLHLAVVVGTVTVLVAAAATLVRPDVKGALVRSTIAQMGFMVLQVGLGAFAAAIFHVIAHGTYKAARFLGSGTGVHAERTRRAEPPAEHPPATAWRWLAAGTPAAVGMAATIVWFGDKPGAIVLLAFVAATAAVAVHAAVRHLPGAGPVGPALAGAAIGLTAVGYGAAVDALDTALGLPRPVDGPGAAAQVAVVVVAAGAALLVRSRPAWLYRRLLTERVTDPAPPALPAPAPPPVVARTTVRSRVALAAELVGPSWPLTGFVASNPLAALEGATFGEATATARALRPGRTHLPHDHFLGLRERGRITDDHLLAALRHHLPGLDAHPAVALGTSTVPAIEAARLAVLEPPADTASSPPADPRCDPGRVGVDLTWGEWLDRVTGSDVIATIDRELALWLAVHVDTSQATWTLPGRDAGLWAAWRQLDPRGHELAERPDDALVAALDGLGVADGQVVDYLRRSLGQQPGWVAHVSWRADAPDEPGRHLPPADLVELLALRLTLEQRAVVAAADARGVDRHPAALVAALAPPDPDATAPLPHATATAPASPPAPPPDGPAATATPVATAAIALGVTDEVRRAVWLAAHERAVRDDLIARIRPVTPSAERPASQVAFCIDVRSEVLRRHLEAVGEHETIGIAGFFGAAVRHQPLAGQGATDQCPVLVRPRADISERPVGDGDAAVTGRRRLGALTHVVHDTKSGVTTPFAFVEVVGWLAMVELVARTAAPTRWDGWRRRATARLAPPAPTRLTIDAEGHLGLAPDEQALLAETALRLVGLTEGHARLVVLCGHGSTTENNPYESALDCGACGGNPGGVNARLLAAVLNRPAVRVALAERGIAIPDDTWFVGGQHDTTTERVTLFDLDDVPATHHGDVERLRVDLAEAGRRAAVERCRTLPGAPARARAGDGAAAAAHLVRRATDWAQTRPEWGLAGCAAFVIGPRSLTRGVDLGGRVFLHTYEADRDPDATALETILTAPLVVAEWISTQYYFSTVDDIAYGAGPKLVHNPLGGGVGVLLGPEGDLRIGLPRESVASGDGAVHEPVRLLAVVQAPLARVSAIVERNPVLQRLIGNGWIALVARSGDDDHWSQLDAHLRWVPWSQESADASPLVDHHPTSPAALAG